MGAVVNLVLLSVRGVSPSNFAYSPFNGKQSGWSGGGGGLYKLTFFLECTVLTFSFVGG